MSGIGQYRDMVSDHVVGYMPYPTKGVRSLRSLHPSRGYRETASPRQVSGFDIRYLLLPTSAGPASLPYRMGGRKGVTVLPRRGCFSLTPPWTESALAGSGLGGVRISETQLGRRPCLSPYVAEITNSNIENYGKIHPGFQGVRLEGQCD